MKIRSSGPQPTVRKKKGENSERPRLAQLDKIRAEMLFDLFDRALKTSDPKPLPAALDELAAGIRSVLGQQNKPGNQRNNRDLERVYKGAVPLDKLKDASPEVLREQRYWKFQQASARLLGAIEDIRNAAREIEENDGSCLWIAQGGEVSIEELERLLLRACAVPAAPLAAPHRKRQIWPGAAQWSAPMG